MTTPAAEPGSDLHMLGQYRQHGFEQVGWRYFECTSDGDKFQHVEAALELLGFVNE